MRKRTTTQQLNTAITNKVLHITKAEIYHKTSRETEIINADKIYENFSFLCESGCFMDCVGWHYERDFKTNGYICEVGRMNPDTEIIITVYLDVCDGVKREDVERTLLFEEYEGVSRK